MKKIEIDEIAEAKINLAYAKAAEEDMKKEMQKQKDKAAKYRQTCKEKS